MSNVYHGQGVPYGMPPYDGQQSRQPRTQGRPTQQQYGRAPDQYAQYDRPQTDLTGRRGLPSQQRAAPQQRPLHRPPPAMQVDNSSLRGQGVPLSQSSWPLPEDGSNQDPTTITSPPRGPPPQRPPRPNYVPNMLDPTRPVESRAPEPRQSRNAPVRAPVPQQQRNAPRAPLPNQPRTASNRGPPRSQAIPQYLPDPAQTQQHANQGPGVWSDDGYNYPSPNPSRPITGSSLASSSSSYSIPDAPVPQVPQVLPTPQQQQRARVPLGPPPSSRKGPPSYFTQPVFVAPIEEETESQRGSARGSRMGARDSHGSYASSNAIPIGIPDSYRDESRDTSDEARPSGSEDESGLGSDSRLAHSPIPVRQASLGKRSKPTLTTIKSGDNLRPDQSRPLQAAETAAIAGRGFGQDTPLPRSQQSDVTGSSGALGQSHWTDNSSSESEKSFLRKQQSTEYLSEPLPNQNTSKPRAPLPASTDPRVESILGRLEKGGAIDAAADERQSGPTRKEALSERVGTRRPPRLNVDAVRDAEARGSLTSLPDLIRRATKLASNLDRGRTASRLGWFDDANGEKRGSTVSRDRRGSGSISDMLSSFPNPMLTPGSRGSGRFFSNLRHSQIPSESDEGGAKGRGKKKLCGMPLWLFLLLMVILILLIAAAVIVPVVLIVVPRQEQANTSTLATCMKKLTCENGGTNIVGTGGSCRCVCSNGFTGSQCTTSSGPDCTTTKVGDVGNATLGSAIPRLLASSQANFSIPINGSDILSLFSSTNLSCTQENALVTFNSLSTRSLVVALPGLDDSEKLVMFEKEMPSKTVDKRQGTATAGGSAATSDGIIFASGSPTTTSSPSSGSSSSSSSSTNSTTNLDFARAAVLFVLQDSGQLNDAIEAQENLQDYFTSGSTTTGQVINAANISLQNGYSVNLNTNILVLANGTTLGKTS